MRVIVDGDPIVYRAGFAAQDQGWTVYAQDASGVMYEGHFKPGKKVQGQKRKTAWMKAKSWMEKNKLTFIEKVSMVLPEPVDHALHIVRSTIDSIVGQASKQYGWPIPRIQVTVLLSGPGNFREKLATIRPYKGHRTSERPYHYQAIRDYLTGQWKATVVHGREADDEASILGWELWTAGDPLYVIATIDKDLDQIPGKHYDYQKHVFYDVSMDEARRTFWKQALAGDVTDNIPGCYKIASATAEHLVGKFLDKGTDEDMWRVVVGAYKDSQQVEGCPYKDLDAEQVAIETARLVYMQQRPGELWNPPGQAHGVIS